MTKRKGRMPQEVTITNYISNNISVVFLAMRLYRHQIETSCKKTVILQLSLLEL